MVCESSQLGHIRKERRRLADEESHVGQELQSAHGNAFRVGWSNDRNNGKTFDPGTDTVRA